jgi:hypothetical protein
LPRKDCDMSDDERPGDETRAFPPGNRPGDQTQAFPGGDRPGDQTQAFPGGDETSVPSRRGPAPAPDQTTVMPPATAWSGRAEVRPPQAGGIRQQVPPDEWEDYDQSGRRWWLPIVLGLVALLLLGALGTGAWLILRNQNNKPAPANTGPATPTASAKPSQTSAAPTTAAATLTSAPAQVAVPSLAGLSAVQAQGLLRQNQLNYRLAYRSDPNTPVGDVIETDPPAGTQVAPGSQVTIVISAAPATSAAPSPSASASRSAPSASPSR